MMPNYYRYTQPIGLREANPQVTAVYTQLKRDLGSVADPIALHAPMPPLLAGAWAILRETLVAGPGERAAKEAVAAAVSVQNQCPWCVDIHGMMLQATGHTAARTAIVERHPDRIIDPQLQALALWASQPLLGLPPCDPAFVPAILGTAATFHYLNRMVNVLLVESFLPATGLIQGALRTTLPLVLRPLARRSIAPGAAGQWLPRAALPNELAWAAATPEIAQAFAGWSLLIDRHGRESITEVVRSRVQDVLRDWDGTTPGLGRQWVEDAVAGLAPADAATARLALLAALASYRIDDDLVQAYRRFHPDDSTFVATLAWASWAATRRIIVGAVHHEAIASIGA
ncbi:MAG: carboxymuconolactone decarboxylase family protein [Blastochloris sp.]|nr:carboxymuconolactone decarboxylase family protein [Blastochloris sp.]